MIHARDLTKTFGDFVAVDNISFDIKAGEVFGFLGANGAGKTTAIKMLIGLLQPSGGTASVAGFDVGRQPDDIKKTIGYMSQRFSLYDELTPFENIRFFGGIYGLSRRTIRTKASEILESLNLAKSRDQRVGALPLGWKQRLAFAISMIHDPPIVFLDEPTGGVDPVTRREFWESIYAAAALGRTVFVTTHYMDEAEYCDRVSIMVTGRIEAVGTPAQLKQQFSVPTMDQVFLELAR